MKFKRNLKVLNLFKKEMLRLKNMENQETKSILEWIKSRQKKIKSSSKIINLNQCIGWSFDKNKNLHHKSGQFFKVKGVETKGAQDREVKSWTQPILTQKHGVY